MLSRPRLLRRRRRLGGVVADLFAVAGFSPTAVADYKNNVFRANGSPSTFDAMHTYTSGDSPRVMTDSDGLLKWSPHNLVRYSETFNYAAPARVAVTANAAVAPDGSMTAALLEPQLSDSYVFETVAAVVGASYTWRIWIRAVSGSHSMKTRVYAPGVQSEDTTFTATEEWQLITVNATAQSSTLRFAIGTGNQWSPGEDIYAWGAHAYRSDLGGMVDNPDTGNSYVPTTSAAVYLPRRNHYIDGASAGVLIESEAATNLFLNSETLSMQGVTTTADVHTVSFWGTGTITFSGAHTGSLVGTGANDRVYVSFTPSEGTVTCTVSGTVSRAQFEQSPIPTSYIPTNGSPVTRPAETLVINGAAFPHPATATSFLIKGNLTYADTGAASPGGSGNSGIVPISRNAGASDFWALGISTAGSTGRLILRAEGGSEIEEPYDALALTPGANVTLSASGVVSTDRTAVSSSGLAVEESAAAASSYSASLSGENVVLGLNANLTFSQIRLWSEDITDAGLEEASAL